MLHPNPRSEIPALRSSLAATRVEIALLRLWLRGKANFNPAQLRVPAGNGRVSGRWTRTEDAGDGVVHFVGARRGGAGRGEIPIRIGNQVFFGTPEQAAQLNAASNTFRTVNRRIQEVEPTWTGPPGTSAYGSIQGRIVDLQARNAAAERYWAWLNGRAPTPENPNWSNLPHNYMRPEVQLDMSGGSYSRTNAAGHPRDARWFWRELLEREPRFFSRANEQRIQERGLPSVDSQWITFFPQHSAFIGNALVHHHIGQGMYATPLPRAIHERWTLPLHPIR